MPDKSLFAPGRHGGRPTYTPPADRGPICMHSGEMVRSPTYGAIAVRPKIIAAAPADAPKPPPGNVTCPKSKA